MLHRLFLVLLTLTQFAWAGPLHDAAAGGNLDKVKEMVEIQKMKVDSWDGYGVTPLCYAARDGQLAVCRYLVEKGAKVNFKPKEQGPSSYLGTNGPLDNAISNGHLEVVEYLVSQGANVNAPGYAAYSPLHSARTVEIARFLIDHGAKLDAPNMHGDYPLDAAMLNGHQEVVVYLLSRGAPWKPESHGQTPLHRAASAGYNDLVVFFLTTYGIEDITDQGTTPLMKAAANGRGSTVKLLLERGADRTRRNKQGKTALDLARANGDPTTIKLLSP
jgi:ankyrin repeat protein